MGEVGGEGIEKEKERRCGRVEDYPVARLMILK